MKSTVNGRFRPLLRVKGMKKRKEDVTRPWDALNTNGQTAPEFNLLVNVALQRMFRELHPVQLRHKVSFGVTKYGVWGEVRWSARCLCVFSELCRVFCFNGMTRLRSMAKSQLIKGIWSYQCRLSRRSILFQSFMMLVGLEIHIVFSLRPKT